MSLAPPVFHPWFLNRAPSEYRSWIADTGSLTQRLVALSEGHFEVVPLREQWRGLSGPEANALKLRPGLRVLQREVELHCHGVACVYAHSLLPLPVLQGRRALASLGNRSLGSVLFADPTLEREAMHALPPTADLPHWGRRSCFRIGGHPLFVSEYFLPALFNR
ncbi:MAG: chorismate--pyruvate lyase family protein [Pseudomonadota bacterium]